MPDQSLIVDIRPPLAVFTLSRPESGNRIDAHLLAQLREAFDAANESGAVRAIIITGSGTSFSAGWAPSIHAQESALVGGFDGQRGAWAGSPFDFIADSPVPCIAAINGDAFSAGFELALACDLRLASESARFGFPEVSEGRLPIGGGTQRLARLGGRGLALELILTGETIDAAAALARGLLREVVAAAVLDAAERWAGLIATRGPIAVRLAKEAVAHGLDLPLPQALRLETDLTILLQTTRDRAEGVQAFKEKRRPHFVGE